MSRFFTSELAFSNQLCDDALPKQKKLIHDDASKIKNEEVRTKNVAWQISRGRAFRTGDRTGDQKRERQTLFRLAALSIAPAALSYGGSLVSIVYRFAVDSGVSDICLIPEFAEPLWGESPWHFQIERERKRERENPRLRNVSELI